MKNTSPSPLSFYVSIGLTCLTGIALLAADSSQAQKGDEDPIPAKKVTFKDKTVLAWINDKFEEAEKPISLPHGILVRTNGVYTIKDRKEHKLQEGDIIDQEGMLSTKGGKVRSLIDHIIQERGNVKIIIDAEERPLIRPYKLPNGLTILPSGYIERPGKPKLRMFDGQIMRLDGKIQTARDSVTMNKGKVLVQKEGSQFEIRPGRLIVMNDGSRVYGNGRIQFGDGRVQQLKEGDVIYIEGAKRNTP